MGQGGSLGPKDYEKRSKRSQIRLVASSYRGSIEWLKTRILASFSAILSVYVLVALLMGYANSYESFLAWLHNPLNTTVLVLAIITFVWHGALGLITVINDYVHTSGANFLLSWLVKGFFGFLGFLSVISIFFALVLYK